ncbi:MAG TPA: ATP-binding protein [Syntrophomonadaceae bacterium]|nr:ATP-binding protein [Syntrophomonadaceae bacterium]HPR92845.1 ATP-binding protein [Syntrophomonadaceae bacterium]
MPKLTDIKQKILQLEGGAFQELCDAYLCASGYTSILSFGMKSGTMKTTKGIPDTYFLNSRNKYILVMYTTQQSKIYEKVRNDIRDCLDTKKTGLVTSDIDEIIYCHTSSNLSAGDDKKLHEYCSSNGISLQLKGIDEIANDIYKRLPIIARDFLGVSISTEQILELNEFISNHDSNTMTAPLSTTFLFREKETTDILSMIENSQVTIISGSAGIGKTRLALECCQKYAFTNAYRLLCIQSNNLPIHEDLKVFLDNPNRYLLMIDDANQIASLQHVLQYLTKQMQGYEVKIVITVRDYAKQTTIQDVREFAIPEIYTLNVFTDKEIKELLKVNYDIQNTKYLDKIVKIAEGNARLAIIAGKLAVETQSLNSINDATQLYEGYYGNILKKNIQNQGKDLCVTEGIIAFLTPINLEHMETLMPVLDKLDISKRSFISCVYQLHELEIVDIYNDKAAKISDQSFGNYLLKYIFITEKIIPFSVMVKTCFEHHRLRVINVTNTLGNIFASSDMHQQLEKEIGIVWDDFERTNNPLLFEFVKAFYVLRPIEVLLMLKEKIDKLSNEDFDVKTIDFKKESRNQSVNNDILTILGGFKDREDLPGALDLIFAYYNKQPQLFMDFYHTITMLLNIDKESRLYDYWTQIQLVTKFIEHSDHWRNEYVCLLFLRVSAELLKLEFSPTEAGRGNTIIFYRIPVELSNGSKQYRAMMWDSLFELYCNDNYKSYIETIIKEYGRYPVDEVDKDLVKFDFQYILRFFNELFSQIKLAHCIVAQMVSENVKRHGIDARQELDRYFNSPDYLIYSILKGERHLEEYNWEKERELKELDIKHLIDGCTQESVLKIIQICAEFEKYDPENTWDIKEGLQYGFICLSSNRELFKYAVDIYLANNTPINLYPDSIIIKLFEIVGNETTYKIINNVEYDQKNNWQFSFYKNLPLDVISRQYVENLYTFLHMNEGKVTSAPYRDLNFLDNYLAYDSDIFIKASRIIVKKFDYSPFMFSIYFGLMFNLHSTNPETLIDRYKNDWKLLKEIYFKMLSYDKNEDYGGTYLIQFIKHDPLFIEEYTAFILANRESWFHNNEERISAIWDCENYLELADQIVGKCDKYSNIDDMWPISYFIKNIFKCRNKIEIRSRNQDIWISHFIDCNYGNSNLIELIFSSITDISNERRKAHILHLIRLNPDPELFINLDIEHHVSSWSGSLIPHLEERINFLESLLPELSGLTYLKHKQRIDRNIAELRRRIEQEEVYEVLRDR